MNSYTLAKSIVKRLVNAGHIAYFAGGWVRDYLMKHPSEDIDIATDAPPEKILDLFPQTILVGLAFGVVIVVEGGHQFEVATFRRDVEYVNGRKPATIELSTPEEDAARRDFTINGMFYDPLEETIYDYVQGKEDLKNRVIRTIGDPYMRFFEDRLRMIRAIRFASRFEFRIDLDTREAIFANAETLFPAVAIERVWQEFSKMSRFPRFNMALVEMHRLGLLQTIFPALQGVHLNEIKRRVAGFDFFQEGTETILYLIALFPQAKLEEIKELCLYLHTSNSDMQLALFFGNLCQGIKQEDEEKMIDQLCWAHLYSHFAIERCLKVFAAFLPADERVAFIEKHNQRMNHLVQHIERIREKKPLVSASHLKNYGVLPGKLMGQLLKEAERIAISKNLNSSEEILEALKLTQLWKGGNHVARGD